MAPKRYPDGMFDWIGSLRIESHDSDRVVLSLSSSTRTLGAALALVTGLLALRLWMLSPWAAFLPLLGTGFGALLMTLRRRLVFDRAAGTVTMEQRTFGIGTHNVVPMFHLRAVHVAAQPDAVLTASGAPSKYVAYIERRVGGPIYLDESRRCARLMRMAEAIADIAEVRLEYEAIPA